MKKIFAIALALVLVFALFTACDTNGDEPEVSYDESVADPYEYEAPEVDYDVEEAPDADYEAEEDAE